MKYQYVSNLFCYLIFTLSVISLPLSATAAIVRTDVVFYDLATASQRSYTVSMHPTSGGTHVTLQRSNDEYRLVTDVLACFNRQVSAGAEGYLWWKTREAQHADPALSPFLNFTHNNRLRVTMKPLANTQSLLLDRDSLTVLVVDPTLMKLGTEGCQR